MSEELLNIMAQKSQTRRLRFLNSDVTLINGANSFAAPGFTTLIIKYPGMGIFVPDNLQTFAFDQNYQNYNPGPTTYNFMVRQGYNGRALFDGRTLWNASPTNPNSNFTNYVTNLDSGVGITFGEWYVIDVYKYSNFALNFQAAVIGTEYLVGQ